MKRFLFAVLVALLVSHTVLAQPRADMRPGWMSEAEEIAMAQQYAGVLGNLAAARAVIRNIAIDVFNAQPNLSPADYRQLLEEGVRGLPERLAAASALDPRNDPELSRVREIIILAVSEGRLRDARTANDDWNGRYRAALQRFAEAGATTLADNIAESGRLALASADWRTAAARYGEAAETMPESARQRRWELRMWQALALSEQGNRFETEALIEARQVYEQEALPLTPRANYPANWALTTMRLGNVLLRLGERQGGQAGLDTLGAARAAYERALEVQTRSADARGWARTQMNLGIVLKMLGERQDGQAGLDTLGAARAAFERALEVRTRSVDAQGWALTQTNLGNVLSVLGDRQIGQAGLDTLAAARAAFERALEVRTRSADAQGWAETQLNLGVVLIQMGERQGGQAGLDALAAARAAFERALEVQTRSVDAQGWALTQTNLGNVLSVLGDRQIGQAGLDTLAAARAAFERALEVRTRSADAQGWAETQLNLGNVLLRLGVRQGGQAGLDTLGAARAAYERALQVQTRSVGALGWALTQNNLGFLEETIGDRGGGRAVYERAIQHYRGALEIYVTGGDQIGRQRTEINLARAERKLSAVR